MGISSEIKRLFFGFEVHAPWPEKWPSGRLLSESNRHITVAFFGNIPYKPLAELLKQIPKPVFQIGLTGQFDKPLFLPERHPHVVAWHMRWFEEEALLRVFQKELITFLQDNGYCFKHADDFLPHLTVCRSPFVNSSWRKAFVSLPFYIKNFHLYESIGSLTYRPLWTFPLEAPFEEIEHTADIAFIVRGRSLTQISLHAQIALAFNFPLLVPYINLPQKLNSLDDLIIELNERVFRIDQEIGCPFKAISFHGDLIEEESGILKWEMIVDV